MIVLRMAEEGNPKVSKVSNSMGLEVKACGLVGIRRLSYDDRGNGSGAGWVDSDGPDPDTDPNKPNKYNIKRNIAQPSAGMWTWLWDQANSLKSGLPNEF